MDTRERGRHRGLDRGVGRDRAALVRLSGRTRDTGPVAAGVLGLRHADVARREDRRLHHLARPPIERDVDAAERAAERVRLDDRDAGDFMRDGLMGVAGRDHVDEPARQALREREDLRVRIARREIVRRRELRHAPPACAARITTCAPRARSAAASAATVSPSGATCRPCTFARSVARSASIDMTPTIPTFTPAAVTSVDACTFGQATRLPVVSSIKFAARNGNGARAAERLDRAARIAVRVIRARPGRLRRRSRTRDCRSRPRRSLAPRTHRR